jgi:uncharacterized protein (DUF1499 family)
MSYKSRLMKAILTFLAVLVLIFPLPASAGLSQLTLTNIPMTLFSFTGNRPDFLGVTDGKLAACPNSPNCVSSQASDVEHSIQPLTYKSSPEVAFANLKKVVEAQERAKIISDRPDYLYVEFSSKLMGFVDDVEFSRLGESDLGVNRQRVMAIASQLQALETS